MRTLIILFLLLAGCGPAPDRTTADGLPRSVVLFAPSMTEAACALGFDELVVAITDYDRWPPRILDRPRIGGALDPDLERLAMLQPDLLVLQGENERLRQWAESSGQRIEDVKMDDDLQSILDGILRLDDLLGGTRSSAGEALTGRIRAGLDSIAAEAPGERPRVLLLLSRTPHQLGGLFTAGHGTFLDELLEIAGATNWTVAEGYFEVPLDQITADPPDLVIEYGDAIEATLEDRQRVWRQLPGEAIPVAAVHFDGLMIPGPRLVESAAALATVLAEER
jgi:iron complex transport system substrate-binding protein